MMPHQPHAASYRDPSGFLFTENNTLYRQVNLSYREAYEQLMQSGLYDQLAGDGRLIPHTERADLAGATTTWKILQPEVVPFISYPYEWCFEMWKDGALLTLELALEAMEKGMLLKDASAYNVQLHKGRMTLIDTLSFEPYNERLPWVAYRQFCEHFLAPLALMHFRKTPLQPLFLAYPDGLPLQLAHRLLPRRSRLHLNTLLHIHLHATLSGRSPQKSRQEPPSFSKTKLRNLLVNLRNTINGFRLDAPSGVWSGYYEEAGEREDYLAPKLALVKDWIGRLPVRTALDAGANEGRFSMLLSEAGIYTVSTDMDHYSINRLYQTVRAKGIQNLHPLVMDLGHPSPAIGLNNRERDSFQQRAGFDLVLALALIHHLCIGRNIPFSLLAQNFRSLGRMLILEFVPLDDEKVVAMLHQKPDIYQWYTEANFRQAFEQHYRVVDRQPVGSSSRILYLLAPHEHTA
jgi:SAM-dependent methyltransferase